MGTNDSLQFAMQDTGGFGDVMVFPNEGLDAVFQVVTPSFQFLHFLLHYIQPGLYSSTQEEENKSVVGGETVWSY